LIVAIEDKLEPVVQYEIGVTPIQKIDGAQKKINAEDAAIPAS
jgi:hypothetical protein